MATNTRSRLAKLERQRPSTAANPWDRWRVLFVRALTVPAFREATALLADNLEADPAGSRRRMASINAALASVDREES